MNNHQWTIAAKRTFIFKNVEFDPCTKMFHSRNFPLFTQSFWSYFRVKSLILNVFFCVTPYVYVYTLAANITDELHPV